MSATTPTPWALTCPKHGRVYLTEEEYKEQVARGGEEWRCTQRVVRHPLTFMQLTEDCDEIARPVEPPEVDSAPESYTGPFVGPVDLPDESGRTLASGPATREMHRIMRERIDEQLEALLRPRLLPEPLFTEFAAPAESARITADGRLFMSNEIGDYVESYDWARFGRIAYRAVTNGKQPPTPEGGE